jgi:hypothetical protein
MTGSDLRRFRLFHLHILIFNPHGRVESQVTKLKTEGRQMIWARMLAYITGNVDQELLLRNEYLVAENRILRAQIKGRLLLSESEKVHVG